MECDIQFKKGWGPICIYFLSVQDFIVYGGYSKEEIIAVAHATRRHKRQNPLKNRNFNNNNQSFGCKSSFVPKSGRWLINWNWLVKRTVFVALIFQGIGYLFETLIKPYIPIIVLFLCSVFHFIFVFLWSIFIGEIDETAPGPQPSPQPALTPIENRYFVFLILFILYILVER